MIDLSESFNLQKALQTLELKPSIWRRSYVRALWWGLIGLLFFILFHYYADWLSAQKIIPPKGVELPSSIKNFVTFMLAGGSGLLVASARYYNFRAKDAMSQMTGSLESLTSIIISQVPDKKDREEGLNLLKYLCYSTILFVAGKNFKAKGVEDGAEDCYDLIIARIALYAQKNNIFGALITSSAGMIRWTLARGILAVVVRFGLRKGLIIMSVLYFIVLFWLITLDLWSMGTVNIYFQGTLVVVFCYLMGVLIGVAQNEANPQSELSGDGTYGLGGRLRRLIRKIDQQDQEGSP